MNYSETVDRIFAKGIQVHADPYLPVALPTLQYLAELIGNRVAWVPTVDMQLTENPDQSNDPVARQAMDSFFASNTIPQAIISLEIDITDNIASMPVIHFFDKRFLSVGTLLHELAHLHSPYTNHGKEFQQAHRELLAAWDEISTLPYFTIDSVGWSGKWSAGKTITFPPPHLT